MDSIKRIKNFIRSNFPEWEKVEFTTFDDTIDFRTDWNDLYRISDDEIILVAYTNISITGTDRSKPQLRVFLDEYKKSFYFAKKHNLRFYLFSIFTKEDDMARGLDNFNPKDYIISIETNFDNEGSRRDLRSIYDYANEKLNGRKFLKCSREHYKADINQASFIYIGTPDSPEKEIFENFINIFDSRPYLNSKIDTGSCTEIQTISLSSEIHSTYLPYLTALRTKPFMLLAGISGTGKSRIVRELAFKSCSPELQDEDATTPGNYLMVEVKPNWHDSTEILGYYSNIAGQYQYTKFVKFLVKAMMFSDVPFFVCLDEMNLAPVEQYFAEFLSVLETRKKDKETDTIKSGVLVDAQYFKEYKYIDSEKNEHIKVEMSDWDGYKVFFGDEKIPDAILSKQQYNRSLQEKGLTLPDNVFIIGTVNMDDTTHQFSRKVIDRAMTIEMNGEDLNQMFGGSCALQYLPEDQIMKLFDFQPKYVNADEVMEEHPEAAETLQTELVAKLEAINACLKNTPFQVSYRVLNEMCIYAGVMLDSGKDVDEAIAAAVDQITLMKILPRIEGDEDMFVADNENKLMQLQKCFAEKSASYKKLEEMITRLKSSSFTRFWP